MTHRPTSPRGRPSLRAPLGALLAAVLLAACGGDKSPTGAAPSITLDVASARPGQVVTARVRGAALPDAPVAGQLDTAAFQAARADDSTVAFVVPTVAPGSHAVELTIGRARASATLQVTAAIATADPAVLVDSVLAGVDAALAATATALAADPMLGTGLDTAAFRRAHAGFAVELDAIRAALDALTPAERAAAAALLAANLPAIDEALGLQGASASLVVPRASAAVASDFTTLGLQGDDACTAGANCATALTNHLRAFRYSAAKLALVLLGIDIASTAGGPGTKVAARIMNALAVGTFLGSQATALTEWFIKPAIAKIAGDFETSRALAVATPAGMGAGSLVTLTSPFTSGRPAAVPVMADYRSITTGDLQLPGLATLATAYEEMRATWNTLAAWVPFFDLAAPAITAAPARTVRRPVPPAQLAMGTIATPNVTATTSASGDLWLVTFRNPLQGTDRPVEFTVRFQPPGLDEQPASYRITLRPERYVARTVELTPAHDSIPHNSTLRMGVVVRDSTDREIADPQVTWASSRTAVATVDASGLVSGRTMDTVTISATVDGVRAARRMRVIGDPLAGYTLEKMDYHPDYAQASVELVLQPRQSYTAPNGVLTYFRLVHEGRVVTGWQQRADFANESRFPLGASDHHVPDMKLAFYDTLNRRSVEFLLSVTLVNEAYRTMVGRTVTVTQPSNPSYIATYQIDASMITNGHTSDWWWEMCGSTPWKKKAIGAVRGGFWPTNYIIVFADGTLGFNASQSCPYNPSRYVVQ